MKVVDGWYISSNAVINCAFSFPNDGLWSRGYNRFLKDNANESDPTTQFYLSLDGGKSMGDPD